MKGWNNNCSKKCPITGQTISATKDMSFAGSQIRDARFAFVKSEIEEYQRLKAIEEAPKKARKPRAAKCTSASPVSDASTASTLVDVTT